MGGFFLVAADKTGEDFTLGNPAQVFPAPSGLPVQAVDQWDFGQTDILIDAVTGPQPPGVDPGKTHCRRPWHLPPV